jgi:SPP1 family predicted phage head-tail adaptor
MLNPCDISALSKDMEGLHPDEIVLSRATSVSDGLGGRTNTFGPVATYAARVSPVSIQEAEEEIGGKVKDGMYFKINLPAGSDVRTSDRIEWEGLVLSVEAVVAPASIEIERKIYATRAAR